MFIDASAPVAILTQEAGADTLRDWIGAEEGDRLTSAVAVFETATALCRRRGMPPDEAEICAFLSAARISLVPLAALEGRLALAVFSRYGKGRGHPAQLNMADCFAYACAHVHGVPLLFVGDDFRHIDIPSATG